MTLMIGIFTPKDEEPDEPADPIRITALDFPSTSPASWAAAALDHHRAHGQVALERLRLVHFIHFIILSRMMFSAPV
ncbi:hypothetical protein [uncultured Propionibacterium sp.]|uniref:hypothetical protein n=1 Tax=uncultured Propionibacterium sp. TaxID=218066 RepID=UPI00292D7BFF|nr:hypothetical protein [uncultured Propionibacterium sp.]